VSDAMASQPHETRPDLIEGTPAWVALQAFNLCNRIAAESVFCGDPSNAIEVARFEGIKSGAHACAAMINSVIIRPMADAVWERAFAEANLPQSTTLGQQHG
jgi:hypothetical protein